MLRTLIAGLAMLAACGRAQGTPDEDLGALVIAPKAAATTKIDLGKAAKDPAELTRALDRPYRETIAVLGPHTLTTTTATQIEADGKVVDDRTDKSVLEVGDGDAFHGTYDNNSDYGRETIYVDKQLYLRPKYQRWHGRAPETPDEPAALRDAFADAAGATWELIAPSVELVDKGATTVGGRAGRAIEVKLAEKAPGAMPDEPLTQRKWRMHRTISAASGTVVLDAETGVPLAVELAGTVGFQREGKPMTMKVSVKTAFAPGKPTIAAPDKKDVVATPERQREVDDRDYLLDGIAPPIHAGSDGAATVREPPPAPPTAPAPAATEKKGDDDPPKKKKHRHHDPDSGSDASAGSATAGSDAKVAP